MTVIAHYSRRNAFGLNQSWQTWNSNLTINSSGELELTSGSGTRLMAKSPLSLGTTQYFTIYLKKPGNPSSSNPIIAPLDSGGSSAWRIRLGSTGTLLLDNASNSNLGTISALSNDTLYRIELVMTTTTYDMRVYVGETGTQHGSTLSGSSTLGLVTNFRWGQANSTPTVPAVVIPKLAMGDAAIGQFDDRADAAGDTVMFIGDSKFDMDSDQSSTTPADGPDLIGDALEVVGWDLSNAVLYSMGGKRIAVADNAGKTFAQNYADLKNQLGAAPTYLFIELGTNDRAQSDSTINADIDTALAAVDSSVYIYVVGLTSKVSASSDDIRVNGLWAAKLATRGDGEVLDWDSYIHGLDGGANPGDYFIAGDSTHLSYLGNSTKATWMASILVPDAPEGTGSLAYGFALTGAGEIAPEGTGTLAHTWAVSGAGETTREGTGALTHAWGLTGAGETTSEGTGTLGHAWALTGSGQASPEGTGGLTHAWALTGAGESAREGTGTLDHSWTLAGTGESAREGTGSLAYGFALSGASSSIPGGSGSLGYGFSLAGSGSKPSKGTGAISHGWTLAGDGATDHEGAGQLGYAFSLSGTGSTVGGGTGALIHVWTLTGAGSTNPQGGGTLTHGWSLAGTGEGVPPSPFPAVLTLTAGGTVLTLTGTSPVLTLEAS